MHFNSYSQKRRNSLKEWEKSKSEIVVCAVVICDFDCTYVIVIHMCGSEFTPQDLCRPICIRICGVHGVYTMQNNITYLYPKFLLLILSLVGVKTLGTYIIYLVDSK